MNKQITKSRSTKNIKNNKNLSSTVAHSESIKDMVQVCADDLSVVNIVLKKELSVKNPQPSIKNAIKQKIRR